MSTIPDHQPGGERAEATPVGRARGGVLRWTLLSLLLLLPVAMGAFLVWANTPLAPMPDALAALQSDAQVQVEQDPWLTFRPAGEAGSAGFIIYPGVRVDPRSYAPAAHAIARAGYPVVIVPMPLNLAVVGADRAAEVMAAYPEVAHWAVGGHSLGGSMAAAFAHGNPDAVDGLALWASYPAGNNDLSGREDLAVTSIYGTRDGLVSSEAIDASRLLLPPGARFVPIQGGNHAQFGWYGVQGGDNEATISRDAQQAQIVEATLALLGRIETGKSE